VPTPRSPTADRPWRAWWLAALLAAAWAGWAGWREVALDDPQAGHAGVELVRRVGRDLARAEPGLFSGFRPLDGDPPGPAGGLEPVVAARGAQLIGERAPPEARTALLLLWERHAAGEDAGARATLRSLGPEALEPEIRQRLQDLFEPR
jgi:hypothetical protein